MYKIAILLAIGAGFMSVIQTDQLRTQLKAEREHLQYYENQNTILQKEGFLKSFEDGYKKCILDIYNGEPKYLLTEDPQTKDITIWKRESFTGTAQSETAEIY
jgi:hypothetical protein